MCVCVYNLQLYDYGLNSQKCEAGAMARLLRTLGCTCRGPEFDTNIHMVANHHL